MDSTRALVESPERDPVFLVEAYRPTGVAEDPLWGSVAPGTLVGVIDIPRDEVTLYLIHAPDGPSAERIIRDRGGRPIRVVDARWCPAAAPRPR